MTFIKFCGMTGEDDVRKACDLGVNALGFVMWPGSPRYVEAARAETLIRVMAPDVTPVAVMVAPTADDVRAAEQAGVRVVQIHGRTAEAATWEPSGVEVWIAASLQDNPEAVDRDLMLVLDAHDPVRHGGTGRTIDWQRAAEIAARRRVMLAGGLTAANVADAIRRVQPFGVDVASGIEARPGVKDAQAMTSFVAAVRDVNK